MALQWDSQKQLHEPTWKSHYCRRSTRGRGAELSDAAMLG